MALKSINPWNSEEIASYFENTETEIENALATAENAFKNWRKISLKERAEKMLQLSKLLKNEKEDLALLITQEMGKPINQAIAEIEKCAWVCEYYAENSQKFLEDKLIETDATKSYVSYEPLGVVLAVMPWNYPFWQYFRFAAPNFMAGNVGLLKHASNVSGCALKIQELFEKAGFPKGVSQTLLIHSKKVKALLENNIVKAATLTGSEAAGSSVASIAGKNIKKTVLELGGTNAVIVLDDCNLSKYLDTMVKARFQNTGQSCIAGKRFLIQENIYDEFLEKFTKKVNSFELVNPENKSAEIASMATEDLAKELEEQMNKSLEKGASLHLGGKREKAHFQPTILTEVTEEMEVFKEETFGPLAAITKFKTIDDAINLSNNSKLGLGASIFTENQDIALKIAKELEEGAVFINELVKSDPRLPFGGVKKSGYGRELSEIGNLEFVNRKTVYIK